MSSHYSAVCPESVSVEAGPPTRGASPTEERKRCLVGQESGGAAGRGEKRPREKGTARRRPRRKAMTIRKAKCTKSRSFLQSRTTDCHGIRPRGNRRSNRPRQRLPASFPNG